MKLFIQEETLHEIGNAIREKTETGDLIAPGDMPAMIRGIESGGSGIPEEAFAPFSGSCKGMFANNLWGWFLNGYGDKLSTSGVTSAEGMFEDSTNIKSLPFSINLIPQSGLIHIGKMCYGASSLEEVNVNFGGSPSSINIQQTFTNCYRLRRLNVESTFNSCGGESIFGMYHTFESCYMLDEIKDVPFIYSTYGQDYGFTDMLRSCFRLKSFTFKPGAVITAYNYPGGNISFTENAGWGTYNLTAYAPADKEVTDDASYAALKNDPDWWTRNVAYSRYNHDSAVETINSLPDVSSTGKASSLSFKGEAGSATDGGAINTLTDAEIAVAAAKGWTITLQ